MLNALSIDVEECFHATEAGVPQRQWLSMPSRVESETQRVLGLLAGHSITATFFILGWVAKRYPLLVRQIVAQGHEVGCHSDTHRLVYDLSPSEFRQDTETAVRAIEDACGRRPLLYRAPSYSITSRALWAFEILAEQGFTHDSSVYPISHDRYGLPEFGPYARSVPTPSGSLLEVPIATVQVGTKRLPIGGGGYLRLLPLTYTMAGIRRLNERERQPACIYIHPWEFDAAQPRLAMGRISRLRTYTGMGSMAAKVAALLSEFRFSTVSAVHPCLPVGYPVTTAAHVCPPAMTG